MKSAIEKYLKYLSSPQANERVGEDRKDLFDEAKKCSLQVVLHKIPNLINDKQILWYITHIVIHD